MVLVGPSGCGKTTALRMVAGLEEISEARSSASAATVVNDIDPGKRDIAMVFQNYALYPHMSVFENIAFPLRSQADALESSVETRVERTAAILGLTDLLEAQAEHPLGRATPARRDGARDRARAAGCSSWTSRSRTSTPSCACRCGRRSPASSASSGVTTIYVTHDQVEAMTMGTRIAVMRKGVLQQDGPPQEIYDAARRTCSSPRSSARPG